MGVSNSRLQSAEPPEVTFRVAQSADLGGAGWSWRRVGELDEADVSKRDYTLMAIHCMYSRSRKRGWIESSSRCRPKKEEEEE